MQVDKVYRNIHTNETYRCIDEISIQVNDQIRCYGYLMEKFNRPHNQLFVPDTEAYQWVDDSFGKRLQYARECRGWTQRDLAEKAGVSNASISRWENNVKEPTAGNIVSLCRALDISADHLLGLSDHWTWEKEDE